MESLFQSFLKCAVIQMCAGHVYSPGRLESKASADLLFLVLESCLWCRV
jgi:hypothetical protein